jgi:uncharacterized protein YndB with AHSA1/START domain
MATASKARGADVEPGSVTVCAALPVPLERAWEALTEPRLVAKWFGRLSGPLRAGGTPKLDFGDGDFFAIQDIALEPRVEIRWRWRFLGIGPLDSITWRIIREDVGCLVTVTDTEPRRSSEWNEMLKEGWTDFTGRLVSFVTTGRCARYDWRRDADGGIELPCAAHVAWAELFRPEVQRRWLPADGTITAGARWVPRGAEASRVLELGRVLWDRPRSVEFEINSRGWARPTVARLEVAPRGDDSLLSFSHTGWEAVSRDDGYRRGERKQFCGLWVKSQQRARALVGEPAG